MAHRRFDDFSPDDDDAFEFSGKDAADQAFWDEFWAQDSAGQEEAQSVTITIRNDETGEEKVIDRVRLRFRNFRRLRG